MADAIAFIESLIRVEPRNQSTRNELGLACIKALMVQLGDPQDRLRSIHLAGSKGKGSTTLITEHLLRASGSSTGLYTSPHLLRWNERYRLDGKPVSDDQFAAVMERLRPAAASVAASTPELMASFFDVLTGAAFVLFGEVALQRLEVL